MNEIRINKPEEPEVENPLLEEAEPEAETEPKAGPPDIVSAYYESAKSGIRLWPCNSNRASQLGADCERQLVYYRTRWQEAIPHDVDLELIFREGNYAERTLLAELVKLGFDVREQQVALEWKEYQITGHIDAVVIKGDTAYPLEIKTMSPHIWDFVAKRGPKVYSWQEVEHAFKKRPWLRKYYGQIQIYLLCKECETGILLLKNKVTGAIAQINVPLDYEYAENLIQRAERINQHVEQETLPDRIEWSEDVCGRCPFSHICCPDTQGGPPIKFVEDNVAEERLKKRAEAEKAAKTFRDHDLWIKEWVWTKYPDDEKVIVGSFMITKHLADSGRKYTKITEIPEE